MIIVSQSVWLKLFIIYHPIIRKNILPTIYIQKSVIPAAIIHDNTIWQPGTLTHRIRLLFYWFFIFAGIKYISMDERHLQRDLKTLARFIEVFCQGKHADRNKAPVALKYYEIETICKRPLLLCPECHKLLAHSLTKRINCPMDPKPQCKHCESHCYHPVYREKIKKVMAYSGRKLVMSGRLDYLFHLYF